MSMESWHTAIGPRLTAAEHAERVGWSEEGVTRAVKEGRLVGLEFSDGVYLPRWQFGRGVLVNYMSYPAWSVMRVWRKMPDFNPEWVILWSATGQPELDDQQPKEVMDTAPLERLVCAAQRAVNGLSQ